MNPSASDNGNTFDMLAAILVIAAINLVCYWNSLSGYFYADDIVHLSMLHSAFNGHPEHLLSCFWSPWQDRTFQLFYRPAVELSLAVDYLVWKANPFGFHLTNLLLQFVSSLCVFGITKRLLHEVSRKQAYFAALFSGALFACYPLHGEVVDWVVGRVDGLCVAFYLLSLWLFLKREQDGSARLSAALSTFALSLLSKEMAVTLPLVVALYSFVWSTDQPSLFKRTAASIRRTFPFALVLLAFLAIRSLVLGTTIGGHTSALAKLFADTLTIRLFHVGSFWQLIFPLNLELIPLHGRLSTALHITYLLAGTTVLLRCLFQSSSPSVSRPLFFLLGWLLVAPLPALQVWCITSVLTGGRFAYLASAALCILITLIVYPFENQPRPKVALLEEKRLDSVDEPVCESATAVASVLRNETGSDTSPLSLIRSIVARLSIAILITLIICFSLITIRNNQAWLIAGDETKALMAAIEKISKRGDPRRIVVLNLPKDRYGAHMFYTFEFLQKLLKPPFQESDLSNLVGSLDLRYFKDADLLNASRLKDMVATGQYRFFYWLPETRQLRTADQQIAMLLSGQFRTACLPARFVGDRIITEKGRIKHRWIYCLDSPIAANRFGFIDVIASFSARKLLSGFKSLPAEVSVGWSSAHEQRAERFFAPVWQLHEDGKEHTYRFSVGDRRCWSLSDRIGAIYIDMPEAGGAVRSVALVDGSGLIPTLAPGSGTLQLDNDGTYSALGSKVTLHYDASQLPNVAGVELEVSPPFYSFDEYEGTLRALAPSKRSILRLTTEKTKGRFDIDCKTLPSAGWYQVRIHGLDRSGRQLGYCSDPISIKVGKRLQGARN
jgi:hypothetical protein